MRVSLLLFSLLLLSLQPEAQAPSTPSISKRVDDLLKTTFLPNGPGASVLIAKKGTVIYKKAVGIANLSLGTPIKPDMVFRLASITKQYTAVAILQLAAAGKLSLSDSIQRFIPDYPSNGKRITIEHLLTHTSGIQDYMQIDFRNHNMERWDFSPKELIDSFKNLSLNFDPGTKFQYSNSGYYILGYIIEKLSGMSYQEYVRKNLLEPLGLKHTYFQDNPSIIPGFVNGYTGEKGNDVDAGFWSWTIAYSAGGLCANTENLYQWNKGVFGHKILSKEWLDKAFLSYRLQNGNPTGYGYGWFIQDIAGSPSIGHPGGYSGFVSSEVYFPEEDIYIAILANSDYLNMSPLANEISSIALGKPLQKDRLLSPSLMAEYLGVFALKSDSSRKLTVYKEGDHLGVRSGDQPGVLLVFQTDSKFELKNIVGQKGEFIRENGKIGKFIVVQDGVEYEWIRTN